MEFVGSKLLDFSDKLEVFNVQKLFPPFLRIKGLAEAHREMGSFNLMEVEL